MPRSPRRKATTPLPLCNTAMTGGGGGGVGRGGKEEESRPWRELATEVLNRAFVARGERSTWRENGGAMLIIVAPVQL